MKKHLNFYNVCLVTLLIIMGYAAYDYYQYDKFLTRVNAINARIDYLHEVKGYSILEAKHITDVEFGISPKDPEYNALIKEQK